MKINRISIGRPISTQFASCKKSKDHTKVLLKLIKFKMKSVTNGKPFKNKPRLTTETTGTTMTGLKILHGRKNQDHEMLALSFAF